MPFLKTLHLPREKENKNKVEHMRGTNRTRREGKGWKRYGLPYFGDKLLDPFAAVFMPKVAPFVVLSDDITKL